MGNRQINVMPNNNMLNINGDGNDQHLIQQEQNQIIQERATTKKILAVRLPVYLKKNTLVLEQDGEFLDKYYIKFRYDSLVNLDCYINFNVTQKSSNQNIHNIDKKSHKLAYSPSGNLASKGICLKNLQSGENQEFYDKEAFIDLNNYFINKIDSSSSYDLSIEFVPIFPPGSPELADNNEIIFVSLCNFEKHKVDNKYEIKCSLQRLRTHGYWIDFHDIFDSSLDGGVCLICCSAIRNTIFLPCKHAACCDQCGSEIKLRFKPCPICKTPIDDLLIIDSDEKKYEGDIIDVDENILDENNNDDDDHLLATDNNENGNNNIIVNVNENNKNDDINNNLIIESNNNNINNNLINENNNNINNTETNQNTNNDENNIILNSDDNNYNLLVDN
jgi:hypothetical protein